MKTVTLRKFHLEIDFQSPESFIFRANEFDNKHYYIKNGVGREWLEELRNLLRAIASNYPDKDGIRLEVDDRRRIVNKVLS